MFFLVSDLTVRMYTGTAKDLIRNKVRKSFKIKKFRNWQLWTPCFYTIYVNNSQLDNDGPNLQAFIIVNLIFLILR